MIRDVANKLTSWVPGTKGLAMPLVLLVMFVMTLLSAALWQYSMKDLKHVTIEEKRMQAHYLARSGAELVRDYLIAHPDEFNSIKDLTSETQSYQNNSNNFFTVKVYEDEHGTRLIESTGKVDDVSETLILEMDNNYWRK